MTSWVWATHAASSFNWRVLKNAATAFPVSRAASNPTPTAMTVSNVRLMPTPSPPRPRRRGRPVSAVEEKYFTEKTRRDEGTAGCTGCANRFWRSHPTGPC